MDIDLAVRPLVNPTGESWLVEWIEADNTMVGIDVYPDGTVILIRRDDGKTKVCEVNLFTFEEK